MIRLSTSECDAWINALATAAMEAKTHSEYARFLAIWTWDLLATEYGHDRLYKHPF